ncbi:hypothetical protein HPB50_020545 [Hyalomma asiaticum]|uniref:Uncharacterized protein n=1 Tax=Hyalomma asiaticum TaxID=266040 RepID=A0ACB7TKR7_HYAAI|nr:hypothetical protein HPB50_020545 [Hyalomma asiaticum]
MTPDEEQAKDEEAPARPRRVKRTPAAEEVEGTSRREAANIKRPRGRAVSKTPLATQMSSPPNALKPKRITTRASSNSRKVSDLQPPDFDYNVPSTSKDLAQKAAEISKNLRARSSSFSDGHTATAKKRRRRARSRSRSGSNSNGRSRCGQGGRIRRTSRHSSRTGHGKRRGSRHASCLSSSELSQGKFLEHLPASDRSDYDSLVSVLESRYGDSSHIM